MTKIEELKEKIKQAEQLVDNLKLDLENLEREPSFERLPKGKKYYTIQGKFARFFVNDWQESSALFDKCCHYYNNYFYTGERARVVLNKIEFLLKMERFYDTYCPDYTPNWKDDEPKYFICYGTDENKFIPDWSISYKDALRTYFPNVETAQTICDKLNEELKNKKG